MARHCFASASRAYAGRGAVARGLLPMQKRCGCQARFRGADARPVAPGFSAALAVSKPACTWARGDRAKPGLPSSLLPIAESAATLPPGPIFGLKPTLTFVADSTHLVFEGDASITTASKIIARGRGHMGRNSDYLLQLERALDEHDLCDGYVAELAAAVRAQLTEAHTS